MPAVESIRAEAARRGVTIYRVRREREALGTGARVRRIQWRLIPEAQQYGIRTSIKRNKWRAVVDLVIKSQIHYQATRNTIQEHNYYEELQKIIDFSWVGDRDAINPYIDNETYNLNLDSIKWYHGDRR